MKPGGADDGAVRGILDSKVSVQGEWWPGIVGSGRASGRVPRGVVRCVGSGGA